MKNIFEINKSIFKYEPENLSCRMSIQIFMYEKVVLVILCKLKIERPVLIIDSAL